MFPVQKSTQESNLADDDLVPRDCSKLQEKPLLYAACRFGLASGSAAHSPGIRHQNSDPAPINASEADCFGRPQHSIPICVYPGPVPGWRHATHSESESSHISRGVVLVPFCSVSRLDAMSVLGNKSPWRTWHGPSWLFLFLLVLVFGFLADQPSTRPPTCNFPRAGLRCSTAW